MRDTAKMHSLSRNCMPTTVFSSQQLPIPISYEKQCSTLLLDSLLTWNRLKKTEIVQEICRSLSSKLTTQGRLTIYKTTVRPIWTNGLELWRMAKSSTLQRLQTLPLNSPLQNSRASFTSSSSSIPFLYNSSKKILLGTDRILASVPAAFLLKFLVTLI